MLLLFALLSIVRSALPLARQELSIVNCQLSTGEALVFPWILNGGISPWVISPWIIIKVE